MNLILIGMPGAGKSTVGVLLAKELGYDFVDTDLLIQNSCEKKLHELLLEDGIDAFKQLEGRVLSELCVDRTVIATGGSAVYSDAGMAHLKQSGKVLYLSLPYPLLRDRLGDYTHRGIVLSPGQTLKDLYDERTPLYEQYADLVLHVGNDPIAATVRQAMALLPPLLSASL